MRPEQPQPPQYKIQPVTGSGQQPNPQQSSFVTAQTSKQQPTSSQQIPMYFGAQVQQQQLPSYLNNIRIPCFNRPTDFIRGLTLNCHSTTATDVNNSAPKYTFAQASTFGELRNQYSKARQELMENKKNCSFIENLPNYIPSAVLNLESEINLLKEEYLNGVFKMQQNGILNCQEYADFALLFIEDENLLNNGYTAHLAYLNNPKLPEGDKNHDHAFVVIKNRASGIKYVVDLWQSQVNPHKTAFIGEVSDFITFINKNPDGRYVMSGGIDYTHIRIQETGITPLLQPNSDPVSAFDPGGNYAFLNNSNNFLNNKYAPF